jgi:serine/threonine protein kinase
VNGKFKLFDFGLATFLTSDKWVASNQYNLTALTGTRRYMAPEVYQGKPYGTPADVYSYAILLWEVMSLEKAFEGETKESLDEIAFGCSKTRPEMKSSWPSLLQELLRNCWSEDKSTRLPFSYIKSCVAALDK